MILACGRYPNILPVHGELDRFPNAFGNCTVCGSVGLVAEFCTHCVEKSAVLAGLANFQHPIVRWSFAGDTVVDPSWIARAFGGHIGASVPVTPPRGRFISRGTVIEVVTRDFVASVMTRSLWVNYRIRDHVHGHDPRVGYFLAAVNASLFADPRDGYNDPLTIVEIDGEGQIKPKEPTIWEEVLRGDGAGYYDSDTESCGSCGTVEGASIAIKTDPDSLESNESDSKNDAPIDPTFLGIVVDEVQRKRNAEQDLESDNKKVRWAER